MPKPAPQLLWLFCQVMLFQQQAAAAKAASMLPFSMNLQASSDRSQRMVLRRGQTMLQQLKAAGIKATEALPALSALRPLLNVKHLPAGTELQLWQHNGRIDKLQLLQHNAPTVELQALACTQAPLHCGQRAVHYVARALPLPAKQMQLRRVQGTIQHSLWEAVVAAGESGSLATQLAEIFASNVDFYLQLRPGDQFTFLVEKYFQQNHFIGYGKVVAAELRLQKNTVHQGFFYAPKGSSSGYFDAQGRSLQAQLLRSPLSYGVVTSRFGLRRHPILGRMRRHDGVDYGVPMGTPVWAVGDGCVAFAGHRGGFGKLVEIRHANGWLSQYAHLSAIRVRQGQCLLKKQLVGLVGQTGLATGPHLHFGLKKNGKYVNSLVQKFNPQLGLRRQELAPFIATTSQWQAQLHPPATEVVAETTRSAKLRG